MIIMPYYDFGDLMHYVSNYFYDISWQEKLEYLSKTISGLIHIHDVNIIHRDLHSGNIFFNSKNNPNVHFSDTNSSYDVVIGDLGINKSSTESADDKENYGVIPYMAPEIFYGQKYTKASDIYSYGMIMWESMTGRRPFWDQNHNTDLIIKICDGLRPPIVTNAPEGYIELMKKCWHSDPEKRPSATEIHDKINKMIHFEVWGRRTEIMKSSDIGPITTNNSDAIYKSRPLSGMIQSAMSLRSSRNQSIKLETGK
jgi:serine/threonine protein kinase